MKIWAILAGAVVCEVIGTVSLRAATEQPWWMTAVVLGYAAAFTGLALLLRHGAVIGAIYGIWASAVVAMTALLGAAIFGDPLTPIMILGIAIVTIGVLIVDSGRGSSRAQEAEPDAPR